MDVYVLRPLDCYDGNYALLHGVFDSSYSAISYLAKKFTTVTVTKIQKETVVYRGDMNNADEPIGPKTIWECTIADEDLFGIIPAMAVIEAMAVI